MKQYIFLPLILFTIFIQSAHAGSSSGVLPIKVTIVQCGALKHMKEACAANSACCQFVTPEAGKENNFELSERVKPNNQCPHFFTQSQKPSYPNCIQAYE